MRVLIFSGSHPRHTFIHQEVLESGLECAAIVMERESLIPKPPNNIDSRDVTNFVRHFNERDIVERSVFGNALPQEIFSNTPTFYCKPETLNSIKTIKFVREFDPEMVIIFGVNLIKDPLLSLLPKDKRICNVILAFLFYATSICWCNISSDCSRSRCWRYCPPIYP